METHRSTAGERQHPPVRGTARALLTLVSPRQKEARLTLLAQAYGHAFTEQVCRMADRLSVGIGVR